MKKIIFLIFLTSCTHFNYDNSLNIKSLNFNEDLTFNEFKNLLKMYTKNAKYPDLSN